MKKNVRFIASLVVLVIALVGASVIYAQGPTGKGPRGQRGGVIGGFSIVHQVADATDTLASDVIQARTEGQSFNNYITENGGDPATVLDEILSEAKLRLDRAVENERMTQEEADQALADYEEKVVEAMASTEAIEIPAVGERLNDHFDLAFVDIITEATGLDVQEIAEALRGSDMTLSDLIGENGGDVEAVKADIIASATDKINQAVVDGNLTQERADTVLENLADHVDELLNGDGFSLRGRFGQNRGQHRGDRI